MHDAVGIDIVEFEIEIDLAAPLVDVRGHRVPDAAFLEHGQPHDELRAVAHAGNDELEDRALVRFGKAAAIERIGVGDAKLARGERLVRRARRQIETRALTGKFDVLRAHRHIEAILVTEREALAVDRSEEHTSELQSLMRISYAVFCLKKKNRNSPHTDINIQNT